MELPIYIGFHIFFTLKSVLFSEIGFNPSSASVALI